MNKSGFESIPQSALIAAAVGVVAIVGGITYFVRKRNKKDEASEVNAEAASAAA